MPKKKKGFKDFKNKIGSIDILNSGENRSSIRIKKGGATSDSEKIDKQLEKEDDQTIETSEK